MKKIIIARPQGFCAGVVRAIKIVELALQKFPGKKIFVNHQIVHNEFVVENLEKRGVIFNDDLSKVPDKSIYIFSAHGVSPIFRAKVETRDLIIIDATCPLVESVHTLAKKALNNGEKVIYLGQKNHQEFKGIKDNGDFILVENLAQAEQILEHSELKKLIENLDTETGQEKFSREKFTCLSQTTLSKNETKKIIETLQGKIPQLKVVNNICYATTNRQNAVQELTKKCSLILVIGSVNSSNSNKLVQVAKQQGISAYLIDDEQDISSEMLANHDCIGISSGASVPDELLQGVINFLREKNPAIETEEIIVANEGVTFALPLILQ